MSDAPRADSWKVLAKMAGNPGAFAASGAVASAAASCILRNQLLHGISTTEQLANLGRIVGPEAIAAAIEPMAGFEIQHLIANITGRTHADGALEAKAARRLLLSIAQGERQEPPISPALPKAPSRTLRRHHFSGASRQGRDGNLMPPKASTA